MNDTKQILCNIVKHIKDDQNLTFSNIRSLLLANECKITEKQLNQVINHGGAGVSVPTIDKIIYYLGYDTEVRITLNGKY